MDIIQATQSDLAACAGCFLNSEVARRYGYSEPLIAAQLGEALAREQLWVAKSEDVLLGYASIALAGAFYSDPYLHGIAVRHEHRSKGIGSELLSFFERKAFALSTRAFLLVGDYNKAAQRFYLSKGYVEVGRIPDFSKVGTAELIMLKRRPADMPNQSLEPMGIAVTPRAGARVAPAIPMAHH